MDTALLDARAARDHLAAGGWIPRRSERFRHLPPPGAEVWLGACDPDEARDGGWSRLPLPELAGADADLRWFDLADPGQRTELLSALPAPGEDEAAPFAWAHRALVRQALRVRVPPAADPSAPTLLRLDHRAGQAAQAPLLVIELAPGAHCVLLETHGHADAAPVVENLQVHVRLAEGASLRHLRAVVPAAGDQVAHHVHVRLQCGSHYAQALVAGAAGYHLQRTTLELQGEDARAHVGGILLAREGALEQQVLAQHRAACSRSGAEVLALAGGGAHVVASAHTAIGAGCDEAQARQRLAGIPTHGQPRIVLRPHLDIRHDNVQAAHGATWGALPEDALFHARQRGLDEAAAKSLLLAGLAGAALARAVDGAGLPQALRLEGVLDAALARQLAGTEVRHG